MSDDRELASAQDKPRDREAVRAEGVPLTPGRSIAIDTTLHVYVTPFFIQASLSLTGEKPTASFDRLMIAQDTGSAIVGPARADIYFGAGDQAGQLAGRLRNPGIFAMLVPREIDPVTAGSRTPLPRERPQSAPPARTLTAANPDCRAGSGLPTAVTARLQGLHHGRLKIGCPTATNERQSPVFAQPKPLGSRSENKVHQSRRGGSPPLLHVKQDNNST